MGRDAQSAGQRDQLHRHVGVKEPHTRNRPALKATFRISGIASCWKRPKGVGDVLGAHPLRQAGEHEGDRQPCAANREPVAQQVRIADDRLVITARKARVPNHAWLFTATDSIPAPLGQRSGCLRAPSCHRGHVPKGPKGEKRPADVIGNAVRVMHIATGEIEDNPRLWTNGKQLRRLQVIS